MNRRRFLSAAAAFTAIGVVRLVTPGLAAVKGMTSTFPQNLYRGTKDGKLYESLDGGETWQLTADFGSHCAVARIVVQANGGMDVELVCAGHTFALHSADARVWRTV